MLGRRILVVVSALAALGAFGCPLRQGGGTNVPPGYCVYRTQPGDTPYGLAKRFYDDGYLAYQIGEANRTRLPSSGVFAPGTEILIPPDLKGIPVGVDRLYAQPSY